MQQWFSLGFVQSAVSKHLSTQPAIIPCSGIKSIVEPKHGDEKQPSLDITPESPAQDRGLALCVGPRRGADVNPVMLILSALVQPLDISFYSNTWLWTFDSYVGVFAAAWYFVHRVHAAGLLPRQSRLCQTSLWRVRAGVVDSERERTAARAGARILYGGSQSSPRDGHGAPATTRGRDDGVK